ncbi:MAG TPA: EAL domain-containing protein [Allosphingosinicella sp.]|jgi:EAL domain-containing protein (putative c-di-GMP-specific phosphodiesterase class I)/CHASE2 domain-containing sensor protein
MKFTQRVVSRRLLGRRLILPVLSMAIGLIVLAAGWGAGLDGGLRTMRDEVRLRSASGAIAIVEIDARSLAALDQWPWPRRHHATLVDRLTAAGASLVAFDVNFEVQSNRADDTALAAAIARADGMVALPAFQQREGAGSSGSVETLPYAPFRANAFLAGVNVVADPDGLVRRLPLGTMTADTPRPSMASLLAESQGDIDQLLEIDYAIDPATIPRFSFIDIIEGRFDPAAVAGKRLIVGGTAADMADRYAVPLHGVLPGVVVHALGAETIMNGGVPAALSGIWPMLLVMAVAIAVARVSSGRARALLIGTGAMLLLLLALGAEEYFASSFQLAPALSALFVAAAAAAGLQVKDQMRRNSLTDSDTELPNLRALAEALENRADGVVLVARIDRFSSIAAALGPAAATMLVQRVADRLRAEERTQIYRIDEDSLGWIEAADHDDPLDLRIAAIAAMMRSPVECGRPVDVNLALGAADRCGTPRADGDVKQQISNAALAADRALRDKLPFTHHAGAAGAEPEWHLSLLSELEAGMAAGEVWNAYQPKLDLASGRIVGVEALVRWQHPERGPVGPDQFIPVVEAHGRAAELTAHVFRQALSDLTEWRTLGHDLGIAVNVSATLIEDRAFIDWLRETLAMSGVEPGMVTVEVTESAAVRDVEQAAAALAEWRAIGLCVSIDDYGTGQSTLGYLQRLPATELKIDKRFIQNIVNDARDAIMVGSTITLAHQLGMRVVAEGIEDEATLALLRDYGCDVGQGWLIGKALTSRDLVALLSKPANLAA